MAFPLAISPLGPPSNSGSTNGNSTTPPEDTSSDDATSGTSETNDTSNNGTTADSAQADQSDTSGAGPEETEGSNADGTETPSSDQSSSATASQNAAELSVSSATNASIVASQLAATDDITPIATSDDQDLTLARAAAEAYRADLITQSQIERLNDPFGNAALVILSGDQPNPAQDSELKTGLVLEQNTASVDDKTDQITQGA